VLRVKAQTIEKGNSDVIESLKECREKINWDENRFSIWENVIVCEMGRYARW
jgi:hypothetical protein